MKYCTFWDKNDAITDLGKVNKLSVPISLQSNLSLWYIISLQEDLRTPTKQFESGEPWLDFVNLNKDAWLLDPGLPPQFRNIVLSKRKYTNITFLLLSFRCRWSEMTVSTTLCQDSFIFLHLELNDCSHFQDTEMRYACLICCWLIPRI